ncbi:hypothetical protein COY32_00985 [candidate division WWE3 bacterium CG_4_10_14_0_2_um_filter_41_14]|uniref:VanZ-like domain-containing protein n=1 Tax=candidate division WWE3 bacterium CG_4_10_14_0_2_um_filter_41_14 TaxID=1975072 RepID=A0A2M7TLG9_UNCKA|nr:MAG: hypothetical protein COY32_00985 [candidate division WWE3 bacterium CG_4_10_14_0_2_um_filter_41_14]
MQFRNRLCHMVRFAPAVVWMGIIYYFSSLQNLQLEGDLSVYDFFLRKLAHMTEYGILTFLVWWGTDKRRDARTLLFAVSVAILYALTDEFHQTLVPTRDGKLFDIGVDIVGVIVSSLLIQYSHGGFIQKSRRYGKDRATNS